MRFHRKWHRFGTVAIGWCVSSFTLGTIPIILRKPNTLPIFERSTILGKLGLPTPGIPVLQVIMGYLDLSLV